MVGSFNVTKTWTKEGLKFEDLNQNSSDLEAVINETTTDNNLWDATRILVATTKFSGVSGASITIGAGSISVDLDDYELEVFAHIDKKASVSGYFNLLLNGDAVGVYDSQLIHSEAGAVTGVATADARLDKGVAAGSQNVYHAIISLTANTNIPVMLTNSITGTAGAPITNVAMISRNSSLTNNVVSGLAITSSASVPIASGSRLTVYKIRRNLT